MQTLAYVLGEMTLVSLLLLLGWSISKCSRAERSAGELLQVVLTKEQCHQMAWRGYVDIASPSDPQRIYRVPKTSGPVQVREKGKLKMWLCLQPLEWLPDADIVVIHKLMIEADEETYLQKANQIKSNAF